MVPLLLTTSIFFLQCTQLVNRGQLKIARSHQRFLESLSSKFYFYQFQRLSQILDLAISSREALSRGERVSCPLRVTCNSERAKTILSSKLSLSIRDHMQFLNLLLNLYLSQSDVPSDKHVERYLAELTEYLGRCGDWKGQASCWRMIYSYSESTGNEQEKSRAQSELELLLENRLTNIPNLDFLNHVL